MILTIGNSLCTLKGLDRKQLATLKKFLSYTEHNFFVSDSRNKHKTKYLIDKYGTFPTGLLYIVETVIKKLKWRVQVKETRIRPKVDKLTTLFKTKPKYDAYPEQAEAAIASETEGRGIVSAPTGTGKSRIAAEIINKIQVPTLIVVPSLELKNQLTEGMQEFFGEDMVGPLVRSKIKYFITVENVDQLEKVKALDGVDCVIIDEFHRSGAKTYRKINKRLWNTVYYKIGLTATPFRSRSEERLLLESVLSRVIYKISYAKAVEARYIVPMEAYYYELPTIKSISRNYNEAYKELVVNRKDRNELIVDLIETLYKQGVSTLVLVKQIEHGLILQRMALERGLDIPFAQGINEDNKSLIGQFNAKEYPILMGTVGVLGEGIDTKPCEWVIIAGGGKSKNQFMQNLGRAFRVFPGKTSCKVVMFRDRSNKWIDEHFRQCVKYLKEEYNLIIEKL